MATDKGHLESEDVILEELVSASPKRTLLAWLPGRLSVFMPALACLCLATLSICSLVAARTQTFGWEIAHFSLTVLSGPFAGLGAPLDDDTVTITIGVLTLFCMFAHPIFPNIGTGIITSVGFSFWFLCGLVISCIAV